MIDGGSWLCGPEDDPGALLRRMREEMFDSLLCIDDDERILGGLERETLRRAVEDSDRPALLSELLTDNYFTVDPDTGMEDLLKLAARTKTPLVVLDRKNRVDGIIPRTPLLRELADMV
jgi:predicted transcriptional regulator